MTSPEDIVTATEPVTASEPAVDLRLRRADNGGWTIGSNASNALLAAVEDTEGLISWLRANYRTPVSIIDYPPERPAPTTIESAADFEAMMEAKHLAAMAAGEDMWMEPVQPPAPPDPFGAPENDFPTGPELRRKRRASEDGPAPGAHGEVGSKLVNPIPVRRGDWDS